MKTRHFINKSHTFTYRILFSVCLFVVAFFLLIQGLNYASRGTDEEAMATLDRALHREIAECYALEGSYPESLDYLVENYGLAYDEDRFYIDYQPMGADILPDVTIIAREGGRHE